MTRRLLFALLLALSATAQPLQKKIKPILAQNARVHWGVYAVSLKTGKVLAEQNANLFFVPASNTKLFSSALALYTLGTDFKFSTRVLSAGPVGEDGVIAGDLVLAGGGDPSLSARVYPYRLLEPFEADRLAPLRLLAKQLAAKGVKRVQGRVVGDDTLQPHEPVPSGWSVDDTLYEYGAPVSALTFNDNIVEIKATAGNVEFHPVVPYFEVDNRITANAGQPRRVRVRREAGSRVLKLTGNIPPGGAPYVNELAVVDPAEFAAIAFRSVLQAEGITVDGAAVARHEAPVNPESTELARRDSPPLDQILQVVDKASQNLHAELVLRAARVKTPFEQFLLQAGVDAKDISFQDGSGMSRLNLVSPKAVVSLLRYIAKSPQFELFRGFLPVGGEDGTLRNRFDKVPRAKLIQAKTGTLSHVAALGGFAESRKYGTIAFQIVANNFNAPAQEVRSAIDRIALALLQ